MNSDSNFCLERTGLIMQHGGMKQTSTVSSAWYQCQGSWCYQQVNIWPILLIYCHIIKQEILHRWIYAQDPDIVETVPKVLGSNMQGPIHSLKHVRGSRETLVVRCSFSLMFGESTPAYINTAARRLQTWSVYYMCAFMHPYIWLQFPALNHGTSCELWQSSEKTVYGCA